MTKRHLAALAVSVLVPLAGVSCASNPALQGELLSPQLVQTHGTRHFSASKDKVLAAARGALATLGYQISFADGDAGVIKTAPKDLVTVGAARGTQTQYTHRTAVTFMTASRSYSLSLKSDGAGTTVVATPKVFINGRDVSAEPQWVIEGPSGENTLWDQLFAEISSNLGEPAAMTPPASSAASP